jgi:hypothetical protein
MGLEKQIREFVNGTGDPGPYDFNAVVGFLIAAMENLNQYSLESELEDLGGSFTHRQREIFLKFAKYIESYKGNNE